MDFHAEATSEKVAMGWHLDGKVTLVVGTHTHVQTADERILPNGTAYLTDAGMTGPHDSIIGMEREPSLARFLNGMPSKFEPATGNPRLNGVVVDADDTTGKATAVTRISYGERDLAAHRSHGMSSLFDLPFEDAGPEDEPAHRRRRSRPVRRVHTVSELTARDPHHARGALLRGLGRRRAVELQACGTPGTCTSRSRTRARRSAA